MKKIIILKLLLITILLSVSAYSKKKYINKEINLCMVGYTASEDFSGEKKDFNRIGQVYDVFLKKSKIPEFKINSIYGNFSKSKNR